MKRREDVVVVMVGWEEGTLVCDGKRGRKEKEEKRRRGEGKSIDPTCYVSTNPRKSV